MSLGPGPANNGPKSPREDGVHTLGQIDALVFLEIDHGPPVLESPLDGHPLAQELELRRGDIFATFKGCRFVVTKEGGMIPIPVPEGEATK